MTANALYNSSLLAMLGHSQQIQLAKMDERIAATALFHGLVLLTRNDRDFGKVSGLLIEDWRV